VAGPDYDFISNFSTIWAVFLGAVLATIGGFAATQLEWYFERARRERNAALFFGEVLSTLSELMKLASRTHKVGDPFGPVTLRMLRTARREIDIYDRNRESLFDVRDADVRAKIHTLILRISMPIDGVFDATQELALVEAQMKAATGEERDELAKRLERIRETRAGGFEFAEEIAEQLPGTLKLLEPLARHSFDNIEAVVRNS
jgi:hypothetical protein